MIPQIQPFINKRDIEMVSKYLATTWVTEGPATHDFEEAFRRLTGSRYSVAFCNGTMSLFTALKVLGVGPGDEVIVPSVTFAASVNAVILAGGIPVVVDIDRKTLCLDPAEIIKNITHKTKAIMPVHLYGLAADMEAIMSIAKKYKLAVLEDAAQGVGVFFNKKHVGTFGEFGSFSFYGNKTITTGEGGMLITNSKKYSRLSYQFKNHGREQKGVFVHKKIGFNFSISDLQSALGISQLKKLDEIIKAKQRIFNLYQEFLSVEPRICFYQPDPRVEPVHWFSNIFVDNVSELNLGLTRKGIQTRRGFYPIKKQPCYKNFKNIKFARELKNDDWLYREMLSLPSFVGLEKEQIRQISKHILEIVKRI